MLSFSTLDNYDGDISTLELSIKDELASYIYLAYSTASHTPSKPKVRIFLPSTEDIMTAEYDELARSFVNKLSFKSAIDPKVLKKSFYVFYTIKIIRLTRRSEKPEYHKWFLEK